MKSSSRVTHRKAIKLPRKFVAKFWAEVDGRTGVKKEILKRYRELRADCGADSYQKKDLCQRAVFMGIQLETMEREAADGGEFNQGVYTQMANALSGIYSRLGILKKKSAGQDLQTFLKKQRA